MSQNLIPPFSDDLAVQPVSKFMSGKVIVAKETFSILQAMEIMVANKISGLPVVNTDEKLIGVFSEMDAILQAAAKPLMARIECPNPKLLTCYPDTSFKEALILLIKNKLNRMPVVNVNKNVVGIVTRYDFMKAYMADHQKRHPPKATLASAKAAAAPSKKKS